MENNRDVNKIREQAETNPNSNLIKFKRQKTLQLRNQQNLPLPSFEEEMDREYFH